VLAPWKSCSHQRIPRKFSWGYNPDDLFGVESSYGSPDAFKNFVKTARIARMAVLWT